MGLTIGQSALSSMAYFIVSLPVLEKKGIAIPERFMDEIGAFLDQLDTVKGDGMVDFMASLREEIVEGDYLEDKDYLENLENLLREYYGVLPSLKVKKLTELPDRKMTYIMTISC